MTGLYVHIPFCKQKCPYCDFYTVSKFGAIDNQEEYIDRIIKEIHSYKKGITVDTIYIGGGTPSLLNVHLLDKLLSVVQEHFNTEIKEVTVEVNPENTQYLSDYKSLGINRISIGVQSLNDENLVQFGRGHNADEALSAIDRAGKYFDNVSCDLLLYNCSLREDIIRLSNSVSHISMYILKSAKYKLDDDKVADFYLEAVDILKERNLVQYEISNFGKKSIHNLKYWHCEEYIGLGSTASSLFDGIRYKNSNSLDYKKIIEDENPCGKFEVAMLQLRLTEGIEMDSDIKVKSELLVKNGFAKMNDNRLILTPKGFLMQNQIINYLF
jgi:oxygen-independent coproporphyrinogen-3 oxidase